MRREKAMRRRENLEKARRSAGVPFGTSSSDVNLRDNLAKSMEMAEMVRDQGNNMSVLGSQLEIDLDPEGECVIFAGQRHVGNTGTGCYKLHDHRIRDTKKEPTIPPDEKIEATYMYAPTPDEEEDEEEGPEEAAEDATPSDDSDKKQQNGGPGGPGGASQPTSSAPELNGKSQMNNGSSVSSQLNNKTPHTPHLLDEPVQG